MSRRRSDEGERFRPRPSAPKNRGQPFINSVIRQANKAGAKSRKGGNRPGARLGRGHVAARFAGLCSGTDFACLGLGALMSD